MKYQQGDSFRYCRGGGYFDGKLPFALTASGNLFQMGISDVKQ